MCNSVVVSMASVVGVALVTGLACRGVTPEDRSTSNSATENVLRVAIEADPRSLEPGLSVMLQDATLALNLHVGLFTYDVTSTLKPYLVQHWRVSDDQLTYTFVLHDDWKWQSGRVITSDDIKKGWERYLDPKLGAWAANYLKSIVGAREILSGSATELRGVDASHSGTLIVTLERRDPSFLLRLGATPTWVAPPEAVVKGRPAWTTVPQGGGSFRFLEWKTRSRIVLEANPSFGGNKAAAQRLEFLIVPDPATALNMYRNDELDVAPVSPSILAGVKQHPVLKKELHHYPSAALIFMGLNGYRIPAFRDPRVRQAFTYAIDRRTLADRVLFGAWVPAAGIVPPGVPGHDPRVGTTYDPARARQLMSEAGYPDGQGFPRLQLNVGAEYHSTVAEAVAAQLAEQLGVKLDVRRLEPGDLYTALRERRYDVFLSGRTADYLSAEQWLYTLLHRDADSNFVGYDNPRFMSIVDRAMSARTGEEQQPLWLEANRVATEDAALVPLAYIGFTFLVKPTIAGFGVNLFGLTAYQPVRRRDLTAATP